MNTRRRITEWNVCVILAFSTVSTEKGARPNTDKYLHHFSCKIKGRNCTAVGWIQENVLSRRTCQKITLYSHKLKNCIQFSKSKHPSEHK